MDASAIQIQKVNYFVRRGSAEVCFIPFELNDAFNCKEKSSRRPQVRNSSNPNRSFFIFSYETNMVM